MVAANGPNSHFELQSREFGASEGHDARYVTVIASDLLTR